MIVMDGEDGDDDDYTVVFVAVVLFLSPDFALKIPTSCVNS